VLLVDHDLGGLIAACGRDRRLSTLLADAGGGGGVVTACVGGLPVEVRDLHFGVVGHATVDELRRAVKPQLLERGFLTHVLWAAATRVRRLPGRDGVALEEHPALLARVQRAVQFGRAAGRLTRDAAATRLWHAHYEGLTPELPGTAGGLSSRLASQAARVSCLFALLEQSVVVRREHVEAALAVVEYSTCSARWALGFAEGDPMVARVRSALVNAGTAGLTRTQITHDVLKGNGIERLPKALERLSREGLAVMRKERTASFNTAERWYAAEFAPALQSGVVEPAGQTVTARPDGVTPGRCEAAAEAEAEAAAAAEQ
jgi:hypothetical protein